MGIRYRKSVNILPGVKMNFSQKGFSSLSFGRKGARMTFGSKRTTTSVGIPGTGLRYQTSSNIGTGLRTKSKVANNITTPSSKNLYQFRERTSTPYESSNHSAWTDKTQWGCAFMILGIFLFVMFLIGEHPGLAFGSLFIFGGLYYIMVLRKK